MNRKRFKITDLKIDESRDFILGMCHDKQNKYYCNFKYCIYTGVLLTSCYEDNKDDLDSFCDVRLYYGANGYDPIKKAAIKFYKKWIGEEGLEEKAAQQELNHYIFGLECDKENGTIKVYYYDNTESSEKYRWCCFLVNLKTKKIGQTRYAKTCEGIVEDFEFDVRYDSVMGDGVWRAANKFYTNHLSETEENVVPGISNELEENEDKPRQPDQFSVSDLKILGKGSEVSVEGVLYCLKTEKYTRCSYGPDNNVGRLVLRASTICKKKEDVLEEPLVFTLEHSSPGEYYSQQFKAFSEAARKFYNEEFTVGKGTITKAKIGAPEKVEDHRMGKEYLDETGLSETQKDFIKKDHLGLFSVSQVLKQNEILPPKRFKDKFKVTDLVIREKGKFVEGVVRYELAPRRPVYRGFRLNTLTSEISSTYNSGIYEQVKRWSFVHHYSPKKEFPIEHFNREDIRHFRSEALAFYADYATEKDLRKGGTKVGDSDLDGIDYGDVPKVGTEKLLEERGKTHGNYTDNAKVYDELKRVFYSNHHRIQTISDKEVFKDKVKLKRDYRMSIDNICLKLARACSNPLEKDNYRDIAGYATLMVKEIEKEEK